jgi:hypothetical protein
MLSRLGAPPPPPPPRARAGGGGKATHDALRDLALQFSSWQFVGVRERAARLKREEADATAEALRTFQLCASAKLPRAENLSRVLRPVAHNLCRRLLARVGRAMDDRVVADVDRAILGIQADSTSTSTRQRSGRDGDGGAGGGGGLNYSPEEDATDGEYTVIRMLGGGVGGGRDAAEAARLMAGLEFNQLVRPPSTRAT